MKHIPFILIFSRIVIAIIILGLIFINFDLRNIVIASLVILGLLTDIFDGIIARKLNVSSEKLRVWDSNVDQIFWLSVIVSAFYLNFSTVKPLALPIGILLVLEGLTYIISYVKFKKTIATHSILAKIWTLSLLTFLVELILYSTTNTFYVCFWLGVISRGEIILIILTLKEWTTDVPSLRSAHKLNRGEKIKRNKLFNG